MAPVGLPAPAGVSSFPPFAAPPPAIRRGNLGGILPVGNAAAALALGRDFKATFETEQQQPVIAGLAGRIRGAFNRSRDDRTQVEQAMLEALLARRGEYTAEKLALIKQNRQPVIYMMIGAAKMRQVESLLRDTIIGTGSEKPWTLRPTPVPEMPPDVVQQLVGQLTAEIQQAIQTGFMPTVEAAQARLRDLRSELDPMLMEQAQIRCERMESKMEDQLIQGDCINALSQFLVDLSTFKTAFVAGPVVRRKPQLTWGDGGMMVIEQKNVMEWERVDPFDVFPSPRARDINDGPLIRRHRLSRDSLSAMIGVEGFSEAAIREVLDTYGDSGYREWNSTDSQKEVAEGKNVQSSGDRDGVIDVLQYWGTASGKLLIEWGMKPELVPDPAKEYQIEGWLVNSTVIKAVLNADPLARRGLYSCSFQMVPGSVWGNSPYDLMKDCQDMCNAAARAMAANMAISSGPQVAVISTRIPADEDVTEMVPWKIWQFESDPMGSTAQPITFFQPESNAPQLMTIFEKFSLLADEYTGVPRYMAGFNGGEGGAGRTASGISMMITNASKIIKQVVGQIDFGVLTPMLERLYYYNMRYSDDPELKGDVLIVARGAMSLVNKEAAQARNNEFLQMALNSPVAQQIMGVEGVAEVLRGSAKQLNHNPDKVVPSLPVLKQRMAQQQLAAQEQFMAQEQLAAQGGTPKKPGGGENLQDGTPTTDHYSPQ